MDLIKKCLGFSARKGLSASSIQHRLVVEKPHFTPYSDDAVEELITLLRTAEHAGEELQAKLRSIVTTTSWTEGMAERILHGIEDMIQKGGKIGGAMAEAMDAATITAREFTLEHPYYAALIAAGTIVALGVLVYLGLPWVLEYIGFAARGPRVGSFAARWMSRIALDIGRVEKGSIYAYLQRLGMTWK